MDSEQQQALQTIRGLLPMLPVNPRRDEASGTLDVTVEGPYIATVARINPFTWNVSINNATMNCTDPDCVIHFLSRYRILDVSSETGFIGQWEPTNYFAANDY